MDQKSRTYRKLTEDITKSPKSTTSRSMRVKLAKILANKTRSLSADSYCSSPASPTCCNESAQFFGSVSSDLPTDLPSANRKKITLGKCRPASVDQQLLSGVGGRIVEDVEPNQKAVVRTTMTSPAISGQKENGKTDSSSTMGEETTAARNNEQESGSTPPLIAWWRVLKMVNLLLKQGC